MTTTRTRARRRATTLPRSSPRIYERWMESGAFTPAAEPPPGAERFVDHQPPPNVTGALHLGHALTATVEDAFDPLPPDARRRHAVAARRRPRQHRRAVRARQDHRRGGGDARLARPRALPRADVAVHGRDARRHRPAERRLGASVDWTRLRFTMDDGSARAVRVAFKRLWDADLVYRGEALVNWCPRCRTTISDLENVQREETGTLWTIRYHLAREDGTPDPGSMDHASRPPARRRSSATRPWRSIPTTIATATLVGREAILPFLGRRLPIVADDIGRAGVRHRGGEDHAGARLRRLRARAPPRPAADQRPGRGGADERGRRRVRRPGPLRGASRDRRAAPRDGRPRGRAAARRWSSATASGAARSSSRASSIQWFVRTEAAGRARPGSGRARGGPRIMPAHFEKVYAHWMENIHDWAVGRQLWWGHRIPAWYCPDGHITVSDAEGGPDACATCGRPAAELTQETDIFDTWFSSGLWPFSTLGWPDDDARLPALLPDLGDGDRRTTSSSSGWRG